MDLQGDHFANHLATDPVSPTHTGEGLGRLRRGSQAGTLVLFIIPYF